MILNVAAELKLPGKAGRRQLQEQHEDMLYHGQEIQFPEPVCIDVEYVYDGAAFQVTGTLTTTIKTSCVRCNAQYEQKLTISFDEHFVRALDGDEDESYLFRGDELDLTPLVEDQLILHIPIYGLCRPDCKGLCPQCGCDLNKTQCSCKPIEAAPERPLAKLEQLLNDDKEV